MKHVNINKLLIMLWLSITTLIAIPPVLYFTSRLHYFGYMIIAVIALYGIIFFMDRIHQVRNIGLLHVPISMLWKLSSGKSIKNISYVIESVPHTEALSMGIRAFGGKPWCVLTLLNDIRLAFDRDSLLEAHINYIQWLITGCKALSSNKLIKFNIAGNPVNIIVTKICYNTAVSEYEENIKNSFWNTVEDLSDSSKYYLTDRNSGMKVVRFSHICNLPEVLPPAYFKKPVFVTKSETE